MSCCRSGCVMDVTLAHVRALPEVVFKVFNVPADQAVFRSPSLVEGVRIGFRTSESTERARESAMPPLGPSDRGPFVVAESLVGWAMIADAVASGPASKGVEPPIAHGEVTRSVEEMVRSLVVSGSSSSSRPEGDRLIVTCMGRWCQEPMPSRRLCRVMMSRQRSTFVTGTPWS